MKLSDRLEKIIEMVPSCQSVADIGTDHAFVPVELVRRGKASRAFACDVGTGPLKRAEEHVVEAGLSDVITLRLGDGIRVLTPGEAETIVITGMGGTLMNRILKEGDEVLKETKSLVLSPHTDVYEVRKYVESKGWRIVAESMVFDEGKYYVIMGVEVASPSDDSLITERAVLGKDTAAFNFSTGASSKMTEEELIYGPCLIRDRSETFLNYLTFEKQKIQDLLAKFAERERTEEIEIVEKEKHKELMMIMKLLGEL